MSEEKNHQLLKNPISKVIGNIKHDQKSKKQKEHLPDLILGSSGRFDIGFDIGRQQIVQSNTHKPNEKFIIYDPSNKHSRIQRHRIYEESLIHHGVNHHEEKILIHRRVCFNYNIFRATYCESCEGNHSIEYLSDQTKDYKIRFKVFSDESWSISIGKERNNLGSKYIHAYSGEYKNVNIFIKSYDHLDNMIFFCFLNSVGGFSPGFCPEENIKKALKIILESIKNRDFDRKLDCLMRDLTITPIKESIKIYNSILGI